MAIFDAIPYCIGKVEYCRLSTVIAPESKVGLIGYFSRGNLIFELREAYQKPWQDEQDLLWGRCQREKVRGKSYSVGLQIDTYLR